VDHRRLDTGVATKTVGREGEISSVEVKEDNLAARSDPLRGSDGVSTASCSQIDVSLAGSRSQGRENLFAEDGEVSCRVVGIGSAGACLRLRFI
jgi:hypothetical protein